MVCLIHWLIDWLIDWIVMGLKKRSKYQLSNSNKLYKLYKQTAWIGKKVSYLLLLFLLLLLLLHSMSSSPFLKTPQGLFSPVWPAARDTEKECSKMCFNVFPQFRRWEDKDKEGSKLSLNVLPYLKWWEDKKIECP